MNIKVLDSPAALGKAAALQAEAILRRCIEQQGSARLLLSTGASQFDTLKELIHADLDWSRVEMFHLDEYIDLPLQHPASFRNYLKQRVTDHILLKSAHFVNWEGDLAANIKHLTEEIKKAPIDLALIGIGENGHIAFNDPPADFETTDSYIVATLDDRCKQQQMREGWFATTEEVPKKAITMTVHQIMQSRTILSAVPYKVKAEAVKLTVENEVTNQIPATILKNHPDWTLFLDQESASLLKG